MKAAMAAGSAGL
jgi:hypothetical protein